MMLKPIWFFAIILTMTGNVSEEYEPLKKEAAGILAKQAETAEEGFVRLDAALALLPYRPSKAIPVAIEELESGKINYVFEKKAVDSLAHFLSRDVIRKVRRILRKSPQARWAVRLISQVGDPDDLRLTEPYFLDPASDPALIPLLAVYEKNAQGILSELLHYSALKSCIAAELLMDMGITDYHDV
ncbi:hypothetical protein GF359_07665, partial [candidate division WOR-3 bacterium]|nr:hypothetical protein [candidate division WOR-3 bacterium]MBD3365078.1 hypothetical protein [candidate division WOR-3 bacterium]